MPYQVVKVKGGFKVQKEGGELTSTGRRYFSNKPLTKERAYSQMRALYASERERSPTRNVKPPTRKRHVSPTRKQKPGRKQKPLSPKRVKKRASSPKPIKRASSPKPSKRASSPKIKRK